MMKDYKGIPLKYGKWGLAYHYGNYIYLNENLSQKRFKKLRNKILEYEVKHNTGSFSLEDLEKDLDEVEENVLDLDLIKFHLRYPRSLTQYSPFNNKGKIRPLPFITWITITIAILTGVFII